MTFAIILKVGRMLVLNGCEVNCVNLDGDAAIHIAAREVMLV
jgi:hypothetical protein